MMKKYKQIVIGFILGALLFGGVPVMATVGMKSINAHFNNIKVIVNGKEIVTDKEPFIYEGYTYLPIRPVLEALGLNIDWNDYMKTIDISNPSEIDVVKSENKETEVNTTQRIQSFLEDNYSTLSTIIGDTKFTFDIDENKTTSFPWDYWIQVHYEYNFFEGAMWSTEYTEKQKSTLKSELKEHQENLGKALIKEFPDKKFSGGYYDSYYRYPNLKMDLQTFYYYSWINYEHPDFLTKDKYGETKPSTFRWHDLLDDEL